MIRLLALLVVVISASLIEDDDYSQDEKSGRNKRQLSIFNVVRFQNSGCANRNGRNGTCYTKHECINTLGGQSGDTCAEGFGTCCVFSLDCGGQSSHNLTYMVKEAFNTGLSTCQYKICADQHICRIRFDFTTLTIAYPAVASIAAENVDIVTNFAGAGATEIFGQCQTDSLQVYGPSGSSPIICGPNSGQHVILDVTEGECLSVDIFIGGSDTTSARIWDITATQYLCSDKLVSGPSGCLQWHTGTSGYLRSFGMPPEGSDIGILTKHMANHQYAICVRREVGYCVFCITADTTAGLTQQGFGVSISPAAASQATHDTRCTLDYIETTASIRLAAAGTVINIAHSLADAFFRHCGRFLGSHEATASIEFCTRSAPYHVSVNFDDTEVLAAAAGGTAITSENSKYPSGIIGFRLKYQQYNNICT